MKTPTERYNSCPRVQRIRARVLAVITSEGPVTDTQVALHPEFTNDGFAYSTLRQRRHELVAAGLVEAVERGMHPNQHGKRTLQWTWRATEKNAAGPDHRAAPAAER